MLWKRYDHPDPAKEFWDAYADPVSAHILRLGDKWCAYAKASSRFGDPTVRHGNFTDFVFDERRVAMIKAEQLANEAYASWQKEKRRA